MVFYPSTLGDSRRPYIQCMESGFPVFAMECARGRRYVACDYPSFCETFYKNFAGGRHFHEVLRSGVRTKVFVDFDQHLDVPCKSDDALRDRVETFTEECEAFVTEVIRYLAENCEELKTIVGREEDLDYIRLTNHRKDKLSLHVVLPLAMEDLADIGEVIERVKERRPCAYVDTDVYRRNHSMRVVYSSKLNGNGTLLMDEEGVTCKEYDTGVVFRSLIQNAEDSRHRNYVYMANIPAITAARSVAKRDSGSQSCYNNPFVQKLQAKLEYIFGPMTNPYCNDSIVSFTTTLECRWAERRHRSNRQIVVYSRRCKTLFFECLDPDCPRMPYLKVDNWKV